MINKSSIFLFLVGPWTCCLASDVYFCVTEHAAGVHHSHGEWHTTDFNELRYVLRPFDKETMGIAYDLLSRINRVSAPQYQVINHGQKVPDFLCEDSPANVAHHYSMTCYGPDGLFEFNPTTSRFAIATLSNYSYSNIALSEDGATVTAEEPEIVSGYSAIGVCSKI